MVFLFKPKDKARLLGLKKKPKKLKLKKTSSDFKKELHDIISLYLRELNDWRCKKCGKQHERGSGKLGTSHYISRGCLAFAWDLKNLDPLCWFPCHQKWESMKNTEYKVYMHKKLGKDNVEWMELVSNTANVASIDDATLKSMPKEYLWKLLVKISSYEIANMVTYYVSEYKKLCIEKGVPNLWESRRPPLSSKQKKANW